MGFVEFVEFIECRGGQGHRTSKKPMTRECHSSWVLRKVEGLTPFRKPLSEFVEFVEFVEFITPLVLLACAFLATGFGA